MLHGFLIIVGCQLLGEIIVGLARLSVPASVVGMIILFCALLIQGKVPKELDVAGNGLLKYIGLLFVPAGAGISMYLGLITEQWEVILLASVSSTILTLLICGIIFQILSRGEKG